MNDNLYFTLEEAARRVGREVRVAGALNGQPGRCTCLRAAGRGFGYQVGVTWPNGGEVDYLNKRQYTSWLDEVQPEGVAA